MITKYLTGFSVIAVVVLSVSIILETSSHEATKADLEAHKADLEAHKVALSNYASAIETMSIKQRALEDRNSAIDTEFAQVKRELQDLKGRSSLILAKRGLVELKLNKAFNKQQKSLACVTGDIKLCSER